MRFFIRSPAYDIDNFWQNNMNFLIVVDLAFVSGCNEIEKSVQCSHKFSIGVISLEIKRVYYLTKLIAKKHNGLIKVITGMRRCGKSYLRFYIFKKHLLESGVSEDRVIEIAFDSYENKKLRDQEVLYPYVKEKSLMTRSTISCWTRYSFWANLNLC